LEGYNNREQEGVLQTMTKHNSKYPNKADFEPNIDRYSNDGTDTGELPLSDPAESNATKVFRENETNTDSEQEKSAFGENKELNKE